VRNYGRYEAMISRRSNFRPTETRSGAILYLVHVIMFVQICLASAHNIGATGRIAFFNAFSDEVKQARCASDTAMTRVRLLTGIRVQPYRMQEN
jgi:hypothetical protein